MPGRYTGKCKEIEKSISQMHKGDDLIRTLLDKIQILVNTDATVLYLHEGGRLTLHYIVKKNSQIGDNERQFAFFSFDANTKSIAGYSVINRTTTHVSDAQNIPRGKPYKLNKQTQYFQEFIPKAVIAIPIISQNNEVLGVLQVVNPRNKNEKLIDFSQDHILAIEYLAKLTVESLEQNRLDRALKLQRIIESERALSQIQDVDILLESLLTEARNIVNADAGSIYVLDENPQTKEKKLTIRNAQNETQRKKLDNRRKLPFSSFTFEVNERSIAGYTVVSRSVLNIPDVYNIPSTMPYTFNKGPDEKTGYKTKAVFTMPLISANAEILGVLQIINPQNKKGKIIGFDPDAEFFLQHFAFSASKALERTKLTRAMVLRMISMAGLRDPKETGAHVNRVASYAVEIYDQWAHNHKIQEDEQVKFRDSLKIAAMLHDVGKVGIPDTILKLPRKFTPEEYDSIKTHSCIGAMLFGSLESSLDEMAYEVTLHHHEKWDGTGYPGKINVANAEMGETYTMIGGEPLSGEEIPLAARIVSLADVYDALCSRRVYKNAWNHNETIEEIKSQAGKQFDPEVVKAFIEVLPDIEAISRSLPDKI